jgi:hypothetical protein
MSFKIKEDFVYFIAGLSTELCCPGMFRALQTVCDKTPVLGAAIERTPCRKRNRDAISLCVNLTWLGRNNFVVVVVVVTTQKAAKRIMRVLLHVRNSI